MVAVAVLYLLLNREGGQPANDHKAQVAGQKKKEKERKKENRKEKRKRKKKRERKI